MRRLATAFGLSAFGSCLLGSAAAQTVKPSYAGGHPTEVVPVTGTAFADKEAIDVYFDLTDTVLLVSSATGTFTGSIKIPASAAPGTHYVTAIGRKSGDTAQASFTVTTPWLEEGFGAAHLSFNPWENSINAQNAGQLGGLWASAIDTAGGTPAIDGGYAYVGAYPGVAAINISTGAAVWTAETGFYFYGSPVLSAGYLYIGSSSGTMYSLTMSKGTVHWSTALGSSTFSSPVIVNGILYIGCEDDKVYALNATTGAILWTYATGSPIDGSAAMVNGVVYIGSHDGKMYALNAKTGALIWSYATGAAVESTPAVANGVVYFGSDDDKVYAIKATGPNTGKLLWSFTTGGGVYSSPAVANGIVYIGSADNNLYALNAHTGSVVWQFATGSLVRSPAVANGAVYVTSFDDTLYALDAGSGAMLGTAVTGANYFGNPVISDGVVYLASYQYPLNAFALQAGTSAVRPLAHAPSPELLHPNMDLVAEHHVD